MSEVDDRRAFQRFDLIAQVRVRQGSVDHVMEIVNLSRGGALVDLGSTKRPRWLELKRRVEIRVLGSDGETVIDVGARVVRIVESLDQRTFAVEFLEVQDEDSVRAACVAAGRPPPLPSTRKSSVPPTKSPGVSTAAGPRPPPLPSARHAVGGGPPPLPSRRNRETGAPAGGGRPPPLPSTRDPAETSGPDGAARPPPLPKRPR